MNRIPIGIRRRKNVNKAKYSIITLQQWRALFSFWLKIPMYIVQNRNIVAVGKKGPSYKSYKTYYALLKLQKKNTKKKKIADSGSRKKSWQWSRKKVGKNKRKMRTECRILRATPCEIEKRGKERAAKAEVQAKGVRLKCSEFMEYTLFAFFFFFFCGKQIE